MTAAETRVLLDALRRARTQGLGAAFATVVGVQGSAYRREGTRMLVLEGGAQVCMLSGGCLEGEVVEVALAALRTGERVLTHYDLSEDATWGLGIGCGGSVDVLVEPVRADDAPLNAWIAALEAGETAALVTPLTGPGQVFVPASGDPVGTLPDPALHAHAVHLARERLALREPRAATLPAPDGTPLFVDVTGPPPQLVLYGAGHDALPLAAQAHALGYDVHVIDPRPAYLTPARFPGAALHALDADALHAFTPGDRAHLIVMNHHLDRDRLCLAHALHSDAPYVGVLGPRSRAETLLEDLRREGVTFTPAQLARLRAPVGLKLGAEAPAEVALSILGELMAWRRGYPGGFLTGHAGRIHDAETHAAAPSLPTGP
ncbi:XdhC family protein [Deinococcus ficus]|uniref:XdhC family protein n=1 Tax=Deinococcus ficus TaxID=317577 RepID=UPI0017487BE4|nr:XdhC/CoxI family protein [Deinococcus ficus]GHF76212.1 hypothetical protein GCM10017782_12600 [Deinococcus ficus]